MGRTRDRTITHHDTTTPPPTHRRHRYARKDVHYLPYIASRLRLELLRRDAALGGASTAPSAGTGALSPGAEGVGTAPGKPTASAAGAGASPGVDGVAVDVAVPAPGAGGGAGAPGKPTGSGATDERAARSGSVGPSLAQALIR